MRNAVLAIAIVAASCSAGTSSLVGASVITAEAIGAAAVSRSQGGCIAICTNGTVCNPRNGLCERPTTCDIACGAGERCEITYKGSQCVAAPASIATKAPGSGGAAGIAPVTAPDANHASPTIVPAAEKQ